MIHATSECDHTDRSPLLGRRELATAHFWPIILVGISPP